VSNDEELIFLDEICFSTPLTSVCNFTKWSAISRSLIVSADHASLIRVVEFLNQLEVQCSSWNVFWNWSRVIHIESQSSTPNHDMSFIIFIEVQMNQINWMK
jgi:hypothetical protein